MGFYLLINYWTHFARFGQTWSNYSYLKKTKTTKHLPHNLHLPLIVWKCSHWRWQKNSHDFGRIIWPKLLFTDWKVFGEKRGSHKSKQKIGLERKITQKLLIKTDFAPSFHTVTQMKCNVKISQFCLHLLAKM